MMVWLNSHAGLWRKPLTPGLRGPASESGIMIIACLSPFLFFPFFFWEDFCFYSSAKRIHLGHSNLGFFSPLGHRLGRTLVLASLPATRAKRETWASGSAPPPSGAPPFSVFPGELPEATVSEGDGFCRWPLGPISWHKSKPLHT